MPESPVVIARSAVRRLKEAVGEALMRWQYVETSLFLIFHGVLGPDYEKNSIVFFHIKSAESKVSLVDKLLSHHLTKQSYQSDWKPIKREIENLIKFRNALAHFDSFFVYPERKDVYPSAHPVGIGPQHLDFFSGRTGSVQILTIEKIEDGSEQLLKMANSLIKLAREHIDNLESKIAQLPERERAWWNGKMRFKWTTDPA